MGRRNPVAIREALECEKSRAAIVDPQNLPIAHKTVVGAEEDQRILAFLEGIDGDLIADRITLARQRAHVTDRGIEPPEYAAPLVGKVNAKMAGEDQDALCIHR